MAAFKKGFQSEDAELEDCFDEEVMAGVSPDLPNNGILYEFSVAPKHQFYSCDIGERYIQVNESAESFLKNYLSPVASFDLITEISYPKHLRFLPSSFCRIHFHGTVKFSNLGFFLGEYSHHLIQWCTFKISQYRSDVWPKYIAKQQYLMEPMLGSIYRVCFTRQDVSGRVCSSEADCKTIARDPKGQTPKRLGTRGVDQIVLKQSIFTTASSKASKRT